MASSNPTAADLRPLTLDLLKAARSADVETLKATTTVNGRYVEITINRRYDDDDPTEDVLTRVAEQEDVTVRAGTKSRPVTIIAGPADWIEGATGA